MYNCFHYMFILSLHDAFCYVNHNHVSDYQLYGVSETNCSLGPCFFMRKGIWSKIFCSVFSLGRLDCVTERLQATNVLSRHAEVSERLPLYRDVPKHSTASMMFNNSKFTQTDTPTLQLCSNVMEPIFCPHSVYVCFE